MTFILKLLRTSAGPRLYQEFYFTDKYFKKMIIITKGDYSANNIGQVVLEKEISEVVSSIAAAYGVTSLDRIYALQDLYDNMVNAGIWGRMVKLYLPILSTDLSKSMVNAVTRTVDWEPNPAYYELAEHGIQSTEEGEGYVDSSSFPFVRSFENNSLFMLVTSTAPPKAQAVGGSTTIVATSTGSNSYQMHIRIEPNYSHSGRFAPVSTIFSGPAKTENNKGLYMVTGAGLGTPIKGYALGKECSYTNVPVVPSGSFTNLKPFRSGSDGAIILRVPIAAYGWADYFTLEDYNTLKACLEQFTDALLA
jgi:hypothetical protein